MGGQQGTATDGLQSSVYFLLLPKAFSTGYLASFLRNLASMASLRSMPI